MDAAHDWLVAMALGGSKYTLRERDLIDKRLIEALFSRSLKLQRRVKATLKRGKT